MNTRVGLLAAILVAQLMLVAAFVIFGGNGDTESEQLFAFDPSEVDQLTIAGQDQSVTLSRAEESWQVAGFPADTDKVNELISDFANLTTPWPVSTSSSTAQRFEVGDDNFQRKLTFTAADSAVGEVLLGTSPGYQRVHARRTDSDAVHAITFSNYQAPTGVGDWLDKTVLAASGEVQSIAVPDGWTLERGDDGWLLDGEVGNTEESDRFADRFANLRVLDMADEIPEGVVDKGAIQVRDETGEFVLSLRQDEDEDDYYVRSSRVDGEFTIATYIAEQLFGDREKLLSAAEEPTELPVEAIE